MPYARKYKRTSMGRKFFRRREATSTIQRAWRRRNQRRRGGLVARTAQANRQSIKRINRKIETKYVTKTVARSENNYTGQQVTWPGVDSCGFPNQLAGANALQPATPGTINTTWSSNVCCLRPICVANGIGEQQRIGEDINMAWLNIKGSVSAYPSTLNGTSNNATNWNQRTVSQKVRMIVVLDTAPVGWKANAAPGSYQPNYQPGYVYNTTGAIPNFPAFPTTLTKPNKEYLRGGAKAPFGAMAADTSVDFWTQSYFENNYVQSARGNKKARFKILKTLTLEVAQPSAAVYAVATVSPPSRRNFSVTIKSPYRFHFADNTSTVPDNQEILVFFVSSTKVASPTNNTDMTPPIATPKVNVQCKLAFKDP